MLGSPCCCALLLQSCLWLPKKHGEEMCRVYFHKFSSMHIAPHANLTGAKFCPWIWDLNARKVKAVQ